MSRVPFYVLVPLAGAITLTVGAFAGSTPADARKLGRAAAGAAAITAGKSAARAATRETSDEAGQDATAAAMPTNVDESERAKRVDEAAARAKNQLQSEKSGGAGFAPTSGPANPAETTAVVCVAGCGYGRSAGR